MRAGTPGHHYEGFPGRVVRMYHVTSPDSARAIISSGRILRGSEGLLGPAIYFADTLESANHKSNSDGAVVDAFVYLGTSLVVMRARYHMTYTAVKNVYNCDSVKAEDVVSKPEYAVYNWAQVCIRQITINGAVAYNSGKGHIGLSENDILTAKSYMESSPHSSLYRA